MKKLLVVVDMQKDFIDGVLGTAEAVKIVEPAADKIREAKEQGEDIIFTKLPEAVIKVDPFCCAGVTPESHKNALEAMRTCQIELS